MLHIFTSKNIYSYYYMRWYIKFLTFLRVITIIKHILNYTKKCKNHELKNIFNGIQHLILIPMQKLFSNPIFDFRNNLQTIHSKIGCSRLLGIKVEDIICVPGAS